MDKTSLIAITVPPMGESISEATVTRWNYKPGDFIEKDAVILELETDKVSFEVTAPSSGFLQEIICREGDNAAIGEKLTSIKPGRKPTINTEKSAVNPTEKTAADNAEKPSAANQKPFTSPSLESVGMRLTPANPLPSAEKLLREHNIETAAISGASRDSVITKDDILTVLKSSMMLEKHVKQNTPSNKDKSKPRESYQPLSKIRKTIARRLKESQNTAAILTTFNEVDMSTVISLRQKHQEGFQKRHGIKLGFMSFFVKAVVKALQEYPILNASMTDEEVIHKHYYDIGVAVGTDNGLVVPIIRDADELSFAKIEKAINDYGTKARSGKLSPSDLSGGTFSITNGGIYGSMLSTPIINPPQSAILGMHNIVERAMVNKQEVSIKPMMYLALSYDHRLIDGREAVQFLTSIKNSIENPEKILLDM